MQVQALKGVINGSRWVVAKTMPECPHEYTTRKEAPDVTAFEDLCRHILRRGTAGEYHGHWRPYLLLDGMKYWVMGTRPEGITLVNRARIDDGFHVDDPNEVTDAMRAAGAVALMGAVDEATNLPALAAEVFRRMFAVRCGTS